MATDQKSASSSVSSTITPEEQWLRQTLPRHLPKRPNDLYLDSLSNFKGQYQRGLSVLGESGWVVLHGLGPAVPQAINLALSIQAAVSAPATIHTNTSSLFLADDSVDYSSGGTTCPAIHIKISLQHSPSKENLNGKECSSKRSMNT